MEEVKTRKEIYILKGDEEENLANCATKPEKSFEVTGDSIEGYNFFTDSSYDNGMNLLGILEEGYETSQREINLSPVSQKEKDLIPQRNNFIVQKEKKEKQRSNSKECKLPIQTVKSPVKKQRPISNFNSKNKVVTKSISITNKNEKVSGLERQSTFKSSSKKLINEEVRKSESKQKCMPNFALLMGLSENPKLMMKTLQNPKTLKNGQIFFESYTNKVNPNQNTTQNNFYKSSNTATRTSLESLHKKTQNAKALSNNDHQKVPSSLTKKQQPFDQNSEQIPSESHTVVPSLREYTGLCDIVKKNLSKVKKPSSIELINLSSNIINNRIRSNTLITTQGSSKNTEVSIERILGTENKEIAEIGLEAGSTDGLHLRDRGSNASSRNDSGMLKPGSSLYTEIYDFGVSKEIRKIKSNLDMMICRISQDRKSTKTPHLKGIESVSEYYNQNPTNSSLGVHVHNNILENNDGVKLSLEVSKKRCIKRSIEKQPGIKFKSARRRGGSSDNKESGATSGCLSRGESKGRQDSRTRLNLLDKESIKRLSQKYLKTRTSVTKESKDPTGIGSISRGFCSRSKDTEFRSRTDQARTLFYEKYEDQKENYFSRPNKALVNNNGSLKKCN